MSAHLDELYFDWLYGQVCSVKTRNPKKSYRELFHILYTKEFVWLIANDDNRLQDGIDLRYDFLNEMGYDAHERDTHWMRFDCSVLELLIALTHRLEYSSDHDRDFWFWEMLGNLGLYDLNDSTHISREHVEDVLDRLVWRAYHYNGGGGLFPLIHPERDQRKVEIWYQFNAYILERE
ncbi:MAG: hypothetical protein LC687_06435 [Actinobacteria bacterium]|nr:hypothetical protein [Actinomycetota bacterium]MCA1807465.1 hypothetical protein [Actinomycetota bacterium]